MGLENVSNVKNIVLKFFLEVNRFTKCVNRFTTEAKLFFNKIFLSKSIYQVCKSIYH